MRCSIRNVKLIQKCLTSHVQCLSTPQLFAFFFRKLDGPGTKLFKKCFTNEMLIQFIKTVDWFLIHSLKSASMNTFFIFIKLVINYRLKEDQIRVSRWYRGTSKKLTSIQRSPRYRTNNFLYPSNSKMYGKEPWCHETLHSEHILSVPWPWTRYIEVQPTVLGKEASSSNAPVIVKTLTRLKLGIRFRQNKLSLLKWRENWNLVNVKVSICSAATCLLFYFEHLK